MTLADIIGSLTESPETIAIIERDHLAHERALDEFLETHKVPPTEDDVPELEARLAVHQRLLLN